VAVSRSIATSSVWPRIVNGNWKVFSSSGNLGRKALRPPKSHSGETVHQDHPRADHRPDAAASCWIADGPRPFTKDAGHEIVTADEPPL